MVKLHTIIPLAVLIIFICSCDRPSSQPVSNNSFEKELQSWLVWSYDPKITVSRTTEKARLGQYALMINTGEQENDASVYQEVKVTPNTFYRLSGWILTDNVREDRVGATIGIYNSYFITKNIKGTNDWTYVEVFFKTRRNQRSVIIAARLGLVGSITTGTVYYDDIELVEMKSTPGTEYFDLKEIEPQFTGFDVQEQTGPGFQIPIPFLLGMIISFLLIITGAVVLTVNRPLRDLAKSKLSGRYLRITSFLYKNRAMVIKLVIFACLYFFIRSNWENTFEFGYDQARISDIMVRIIENGDYLNITHHIFFGLTEDIATFGPFLMYFLLPWYLVTRDPVIITHILIVINFLGIVFIYQCAEILYNKRVAVFSTFFIIAFPWSVIFSRMIYNPTPLLCFIPLVLYTTLLIVKKNRQKLLFILPIFWGMMIQFHYMSFPVVLFSFAYIIMKGKQIKWNYFFAGCAIGIIPWIPVIKSEFDTDFKFVKGIFSARSVLAKQYNPGEIIGLTIEKTFGYLTVREIEAHISYGKSALYSLLPLPYFVFQFLYSVLFIAGIVYSFIKLLRKRRSDDIIVFLWFLSIPLFIIIFNLKISISPRYYLIVIFPLAFMIGNTIDETLIFIFNRKFINNIPGTKSKHIDFCSYAISSVFVLFFFIFMISYYNFILLFDYPEPGFFGWLHQDSAPPYSFTYNSLKYALTESQKQGYDRCVFSSDTEISDDSFASPAQRYIWEQVLKKNLSYTDSLPFYYIALGPPPDSVPVSSITRFGPFRVYRPVQEK